MPDSSFTKVNCASTGFAAEDLVIVKIDESQRAREIEARTLPTPRVEGTIGAFGENEPRNSGIAGHTSGGTIGFSRARDHGRKDDGSALKHSSPVTIGRDVRGDSGTLGAFPFVCRHLWVVSFAVAQQTREIGIRTALGATARQTLGRIIGAGMKPVLIGSLIGLVSSFGLSLLMTNLLFGLSPIDPISYLGAMLFQIAVALLAMLIPARAAVRVDPVVALADHRVTTTLSTLTPK